MSTASNCRILSSRLAFREDVEFGFIVAEFVYDTFPVKQKCIASLPIFEVSRSMLCSVENLFVKPSVFVNAANALFETSM